MYQPAAFREDRLEILHALIRSHPLATLITAGEGGLIANLVPFIVTEASWVAQILARLRLTPGEHVHLWLRLVRAILFARAPRGRRRLERLDANMTHLHEF